LSASNDPTASAVKGAVEGALEWTAERISRLAARIQGHSAAAASDPVRLESIRRASKSEEARFLKTYVTDPAQRRIINDGLTLHELGEGPENVERLQSIRADLRRAANITGLHGAEIVQGGVLGLFIRHMMREGRSRSEISSAACTLLETVDKWTYFVQSTDRAAEVVEEVKVRVLANQPGVFIVFGSGQQKRKAKAIVDAVMKRLPKGFTTDSHDSGREFVAFIGRENEGRFELRVPA